MSLRLELKIQGRNLKSEESIVCTLLEFSNNSWVQRGQTESSKPKNTNPDFVTSIQIAYCFEKNQLVRFIFSEVGGAKRELGVCNTTLAALMIAPQLRYEAELENTRVPQPGKIVVKTDVVQKSNKVYKFEFVWPNCGNVVGKCCGEASQKVRFEFFR